MANLLSLSDRFAYIRVSVPRADYERLRRHFAGESYALREVRLAFHAALRALMLDVTAVELPRRTTGFVNASLDPAAVDVPASSTSADSADQEVYRRESGGW